MEFIWKYVGGCVSGSVPSAECTPLWQFGIIILLLVFAVAGLVVIRILMTHELKPLPSRPPGSTARKP